MEGSLYTLQFVQGTTTIQANEFAIFADNAETWLAAHLQYTGILFDTVLSLKNTSSTIGLSLTRTDPLFTSVSYDASWGGNGNGYTLERAHLEQFSDLTVSWSDSAVLGGTPGSWMPPREHDTASSTDPSGDDTSTDDTPLPPPDDSHDVSEGDNGAGHDGEISAGTSVEVSYFIHLSEILPNPKGSDSGEWVELYNESPFTIDLAGWQLQDATSRVYTISEADFSTTDIQPLGYFQIPREASDIALNNTGGDSLIVYAPGGDFRERTDYTGSAKEDAAWALIGGQWRWTTDLTPGKANIGSVDQKPVASFTIEESERYYIGESITFDGSASSDIESKQLQYFWDFGDDTTDDEQITTHSYDGAGEYEVAFSVTDEAGQTTSASHLIHIEIPVEQMTLGEIAPITFSPGVLFITEAVPNPDGSDDAEWIELKNASDHDIMLTGWQLDDSEGGSAPYVFSETVVIPVHSYLVVGREASKLSLNNDSDMIRLLTPLGQEWQTVSYEKAPSGYSYAYDEINQEWLWLTTPTPGAITTFDDAEFPRVLGTIYEASVLEDVTLVTEEMQGSLVAVRGFVIVPPHTIGSQKLYIASAGDVASSPAALEIYQYRGDFPGLARGDRIEVTGEVSMVQGRPRVKISNAHDIVFLEHSQLETPETMSIIDISEEFDRSLVTIQGTVDRVNKKSFSLNEGDGRITVYLGDGVAMGDLHLAKDAQVSVAGFLQYQSGTPRLRLIDSDDVAAIKVSDGSLQSDGQAQEQIEKPAVAAESPLRPWLYAATLPITASIGWIIKKFFLTKFQ